MPLQIRPSFYGEDFTEVYARLLSELGRGEFVPIFFAHYRPNRPDGAPSDFPVCVGFIGYFEVTQTRRGRAWGDPLPPLRVTDLDRQYGAGLYNPDINPPRQLYILNGDHRAYWCNTLAFQLPRWSPYLLLVNTHIENHQDYPEPFDYFDELTD